MNAIAKQFLTPIDNWLCVCIGEEWGERLHWNKSKSHIVICDEENKTYLDAYAFLVYFFFRKKVT